MDSVLENARLHANDTRYRLGEQAGHYESFFCGPGLLQPTRRHEGLSEHENRLLSGDNCPAAGRRLG